jgi:hypothetical protein
VGFEDGGVVVVWRRVKTRQAVVKAGWNPGKPSSRRRVAAQATRAIAVAVRELNLRSLQHVPLVLSVRPVARTIDTNHLSDDARPSRHAHLDHYKMNESFDRVGADVHAYRNFFAAETLCE